MSVKYVPIIKHQTEFCGDRCVFDLEPLDRATFLMAQSELSKAISADQVSKHNATYDVGCRVLEVCLLKVDGLTDVANLPVSKETLINKIFFKPLVVELFKVLIEEGNLGKASSSDSEEKSLDSSAERS